MNETKSAVLLLAFNRPALTARVFGAIREYAPQKLYVAIDGPRLSTEDDKEKCEAVRRLVDRPDWNCEIKKRYRASNLGVKDAAIDAITWFFEQEEEGIILEDDCLPSQSFFHFSHRLLEEYRHDDRIMHIGGSNLQFGHRRGQASYYFSSIASVWGWASWRRVWTNFDARMSRFEEFEKSPQMRTVFPDDATAEWALGMFRQVYEDKILAWDYRLALTIIIANGLCVTPNTNLVSNIGFGGDGTHTTNARDIHSNIPAGYIGELTHPSFFVPDREADIYQLSHSIPRPVAPHAQPPLLNRIFNKAKRSLTALIPS